MTILGQKTVHFYYKDVGVMNKQTNALQCFASPLLTSKYSMKGTKQKNTFGNNYQCTDIIQL